MKPNRHKISDKTDFTHMHVLLQASWKLLSSESEGEGFVDLCSDGEDRTVLCSDSTVACSSDREDDGYGDRSTRFRPPIHSLSLSTTSDENSDEEPIMLEVDSFLSDTRQASSFYRPAENRPATGKISKLTKKDLLRQPITSVIDAQADIGSEVPEKSFFSVDEKVVYEDALQVWIFGLIDILVPCSNI